MGSEGKNDDKEVFKTPVHPSNFVSRVVGCYPNLSICSDFTHTKTRQDTMAALAMRSAHCYCSSAPDAQLRCSQLRRLHCCGSGASATPQAAAWCLGRTADWTWCVCAAHAYARRPPS
eukprot:COSAG02_NODE_19583_length_874_cov_17.498065_1_plen_118_part_00